MERLLQYVWKYRLYPENQLATTMGIPVAVIDPGLSHADAGPDFFNAKIRIGDTLWVGNVEIHRKASDWKLHGHDANKAYDTVILHVTEIADMDIRRTNGELIPQVVLPVPSALRENMEWLLHPGRSLPCLAFIPQVDHIHLVAWMGTLLSERLERKVGDICRLLEHYRGDWNEVFYVLLTRTFGMGLNNDMFERLARSLPFRCIQKQRSNLVQVEAMLFGQAGMLEEDGTDGYYRLLQREYLFLRRKYGLEPLDASLFRSLRTRPGAFPQLKLAQLASIWAQHDTLFSVIRETAADSLLPRLFQVQPSAYWTTHYLFGQVSPAADKVVGDFAIRILLINTVAPLLFAWGEQKQQPVFCERALQLLDSLPAEHNHIVSLFSRAGIGVRNAADSQALIQLKQAYCDQQKCLYCRIGFRLLKRGLAE